MFNEKLEELRKAHSDLCAELEYCEHQTCSAKNRYMSARDEWEDWDRRTDKLESECYEAYTDLVAYKNKVDYLSLYRL